MLFIPKLIAGYSGAIVDIINYLFFIFTAILGIPVIFIIIYLNKVKLNFTQNNFNDTNPHENNSIHYKL